MREKFLYGLIIDLINSRYTLHLCLNCSSSSAIVSSSRELGFFRILADAALLGGLDAHLRMLKVILSSVDGNVERHQKAQAIWPTVGLTLFIYARCTLPFWQDSWTGYPWHH